MSASLTIKQRKFAEIYLQTGNKTRAAREAGYGGKALAQTAQDILVNRPGVRDYINRRRAVMMERHCINTSEIIGGLAEIATSSIADVIESDGSFDIEKCKERGTDHLIKKVKVTVRFTKEGERIVTTELEMYSRLEALAQLVPIFGLKQADRTNDHDENALKENIAKFIEECRARGWVTDEAQAARLLAEDADVIETTAEVVEEPAK